MADERERERESLAISVPVRNCNMSLLHQKIIFCFSTNLIKISQAQRRSGTHRYLQRLPSRITHLLTSAYFVAEEDFYSLISNLLYIKVSIHY